METYSCSRYRYQPVLMHHGIKGMRWGVRRFQNEDGSLTPRGQRRYDIDEAKSAYKQAKRELKQTRKEVKKNLRIRKTGIFAGRDYKRTLDANKDRLDDAEMKKIDARAAIAKAKNGEKGELKAYAKEMKKTGLSGSKLDSAAGDRSTKIYDRLATKRGEQYAKRVEKQTKKEMLKSVGVAAAAVVGLKVAGKIITRATPDDAYDRFMDWAMTR